MKWNEQEDRAGKTINEAEDQANAKISEPEMQDIRYHRRKLDQKARLIKDLPIQVVDCILHEDDYHCE